MKIIGVTGTIGSGKSTVCQILVDLGCPVIDADLEAHATYRRGTHTYRHMVAAFGDAILDDKGSIDRESLGRVVFADSAARDRLNAIVHPATRRRVSSRLRRLAGAGHEWAAVEATLLIEAGWRNMVDRLWVVTAPTDHVIARLRRDRGQDEELVRRRMTAQMPPLRMMEQADDIIYNDGGVQALRMRVTSLWNAVSQPASSTAEPA